MERNMYITYLLLLLLLRISVKKSRKNGLKRDWKKRHLYIDTLNGVHDTMQIIKSLETKTVNG